MSSYIDHFQRGPVPWDESGPVCIHSWADFTAQRRAWLYGDEDRTSQQAADVASWDRLGAGKAVAA